MPIMIFWTGEQEIPGIGVKKKGENVKRQMNMAKREYITATKKLEGSYLYSFKDIITYSCSIKIFQNLSYSIRAIS